MTVRVSAGHTTRNILIGLGLLSLGVGAWSYWQGSIPRWGLVLVGLVGLIALYYLLWTAYLGGKARHIELRAGGTHTSILSLRYPALNNYSVYRGKK
ncbi:MAG: hypothetical protein ABEK50_13395 [bacterium]